RLRATGAGAEGVRDARRAAEGRRDLHIRFWNRIENERFEARHPRFLEVAELLCQLWLSPVCRDSGRVCGTPAQHFGQLRDDLAVVGRRSPGAGPGLEPETVRESAIDTDVETVPVFVLLAKLVRQCVVVLG